MSLISTLPTPSTPIPYGALSQPCFGDVGETHGKRALTALAVLTGRKSVQSHFLRVLPRGRPAAGTQTPDSFLFAEIFTNEMPRWTTI